MPSFKAKLLKSLSLLLLCLLILPASVLWSQEKSSQNGKDLDKRVQKFLDTHRGTWHDLNVPESDGKALYYLILKNGYKRALEIGTSTGHSTIWIAWALSKTGGKLITIEINKERYQKALKNFQEAGLSDYIDARLADAHELVPRLKGTFDFIFVDADKDWYVKYLQMLLPKLEIGGCFTAHNVLNTYMRGIPEFMDFLKKQSNLKTTILKTSSSGISVSYKIAK